MRGGFRTEQKLLAVFPSINARLFSVGTETPGGVFQFKCEAFVGQNPNSWQLFPVWARVVFLSELKFLAVFPSLFARRFSVGAEIPRDVSQFKCLVFLGQ